MAYRGTIGKIAVKGEQDVEWKIDNIFSFRAENEYYLSPKFSSSNSKWYLKIYPNGEEGYKGSISLYLVLPYFAWHKCATYYFGLKRYDGHIYKIGPSLNWIFDKRGSGFGYAALIKRSVLAARKSELAPSDTLTITCTVLDGSDCTKRSSLNENFLDMFTSQKACDATLQVKQEKFSVHKFVLMARSPVFAAMFEIPMKEKTTGVVDIQDCDPKAFRDFLVYLYSGRLQKLSRHMFELYMIADKYNVQDLKSECIVAIMRNLSLENVTDVAILAEKFEESGLKRKSRQFFSKNFGKIFRTRKWEAFLKREPSLANEMLKDMSNYLDRKSCNFPKLNYF